MCAAGGGVAEGGTGSWCTPARVMKRPNSTATVAIRPRACVGHTRGCGATTDGSRAKSGLRWATVSELSLSIEHQIAMIWSSLRRDLAKWSFLRERTRSSSYVISPDASSSISLNR